MSALRTGVIGILPAGALGVSLFHHLTAQSSQIDGRVCFLERPGSRSAAALKGAGVFRVETGNAIRELPLPGLLLADPITCYQRGELPEMLLVCTNPDQLLELVTHFVELLVAISTKGELLAESLPFPAVSLCSNGIYHQRVRQVFVEKLEEATLYGRLPDLWPDLMPKIVGKWLRGVTIQTGVRDGSGADAIYRPGPSGCTRIAGGAPDVRRRVIELCAGRGAWFEDAGEASPTRAEFDKAIVNLTSNLFGLLQAIDAEGRFRRLQVRELITPAVLPRLEELTAQVVRVGQAVRAYPPTEKLATQLARLHDTLHLHRDHVPSSVQWVDVELRRGRLRAELPPTERWLIGPLVRYAESAQLPDTSEYFRALERELIDKLRRAIRRNEPPLGTAAPPC